MSTQPGWEGDRLEPALTQREARRLGELARDGAPQPGNGAMGFSKTPVCMGTPQVPTQRLPLQGLLSHSKEDGGNGDVD